MTSVDYMGNVARSTAEISDGAETGVNLPGAVVFWAEQQQVYSSLDARQYRVQADSTIRIDGAEIRLTTGDTVSAVIAKINEANAPVKARLDPVASSLVIESTIPHQLWMEDIDGGTVLQDLGILAQGSSRPPLNVAGSARVFGGSLFDMVINLRDALLEGSTEKVGSGGLRGIENAITSLVVRARRRGRARRAPGDHGEAAGLGEARARALRLPGAGPRPGRGDHEAQEPGVHPRGRAEHRRAGPEALAAGFPEVGMKVLTRPYGEIEVDERQKVRFPYGLFGFEELREFVLLDAAQQPFYWLQSLESPTVAFVLIDPLVFRPDYTPDVDSEELVEIGVQSPEDLLVLAIVTFAEGQKGMTANLQGPLLLNRRTRTGRQAISGNPRWSVRHPILEESARAGSGSSAC